MVVQIGGAQGREPAVLRPRRIALSTHLDSNSGVGLAQDLPPSSEPIGRQCVDTIVMPHYSRPF